MPTQTIDLNNTLPAAPAGFQNNEWQADPPSLDPTVVRKVSNYTPAATSLAAGAVKPDGAIITVDADGGITVAKATTSSLGVVKPDGISILIDSAGMIFTAGMAFAGNWDPSTAYKKGDVTIYGGIAYLALADIPVSGVPAMVQAKATRGVYSTSFTSNVTAGNLLVVFIYEIDSATMPGTPTDTLGTSYTLVKSVSTTFFSDPATIAMYCGLAPASGANTVSFVSSGRPTMAVAEFSGVSPTVDATAASGAATQSITTTQATLIVNAIGDYAATETFAGGTAGTDDSSVPGSAIGHLSEGSAGTYTSGFTISSGSLDWAALISAAFRTGVLSPDIDSARWVPLGIAGVITTEGDLIIGGPGGIPVRLVAGTSGQVLTSNGAGTEPTWQTFSASLPTGSGRKFIATPSDGSSAVAALRAIVPADVPTMVGDSGTGGTAGLVPAPAAGDAAAGKVLKADGTWYVPPGFANPMTTQGDIIVAGASGAPGRLAAGTSGYVLTANGAGAAPSWQAASGGGGGFSNPMTTQGDLIVGGASGAAGRLAASTSGYVLTSNGPGASPSWQAASGGGGGSAGYTVPPLTGWTWDVQGTSTIDTSTGSYIKMVAAQYASGMRMYYRTPPSTPYTISTVISSQFTGGSDIAIDLGFRDSAGKYVVLHLSTNGNIYVFKFSASNAPVAAYTSTAFALSAAPAVSYLQIEDDGTNLTFFYGVQPFIGSATVWTQLYTVSRTNYLTGGPAAVAWGAYTNGSAVTVYLGSWAVS